MAFASRAQLLITVVGCVIGAVAVARHEQRKYAFEHALTVHSAAGPQSGRAEGRVHPVRSEPLDLNHASEGDLETLPGVGPRLAAKIVEFRQAHGPFRNAQELDAVPGVGAKLLAKLLPHVRTAGP